jgi:hypothetical protein
VNYLRELFKLFKRECSVESNPSGILKMIPCMTGRKLRGRRKGIKKSGRFATRTKWSRNLAKDLVCFCCPSE